MALNLDDLVVIGQAFVDVFLSQSEEFVDQIGFRAFEQNLPLFIDDFPISVALAVLAYQDTLFA